MILFVNTNPFFFTEHLGLILLATVWTIFWKGYGVWTAVKNNHKGWFIALIVLNTLGVLEIIYLFAVAKKKWVDVKRVFVKVVTFKK